MPFENYIREIRGAGATFVMLSMTPDFFAGLNKVVEDLRPGGIAQLWNDINSKRAIQPAPVPKSLVEFANAGKDASARPADADAVKGFLVEFDGGKLAPLGADPNGQEVLKRVANILLATDALRGDEPVSASGSDAQLAAMINAIQGMDPAQMVDTIDKKGFAPEVNAAAQPPDVVDMDICSTMATAAGMSPDALTALPPGAGDGDAAAFRSNKDAAVAAASAIAAETNLGPPAHSSDPRASAQQNMSAARDLLSQANTEMNRGASEYIAADAVIEISTAATGGLTASSDSTGIEEETIALTVYESFDDQEELRAIEVGTISAATAAKVEQKAEEVKKNDDPHGLKRLTNRVPLAVGGGPAVRQPPHFTAPAESDSLQLPAAQPIQAGDPARLFSDVLTVEAWVRADWDPSKRQDRACILSLSGTIDLPGDHDLAEFSLLISPDAKNLLILFTGGVTGNLTEIVVPVQFNFADRQFHHVTVYLTRDVIFTRVVIDEQQQQNAGGLPFINFFLNTVAVGSRKNAERFEGRVARLTMWNREVSLPELMKPQSDTRLVGRLNFGTSVLPAFQLIQKTQIAIKSKAAAGGAGLTNHVGGGGLPLAAVADTGLKLPAPAPVRGGDEGWLLGDILTIETKVRADWVPGSRSDAACILHMTGNVALPNDADQAEFALFITPDKQNLKISFSGLPLTVSVDTIVPFDFSDGKMHHISIFLARDTSKLKVSFDGAAKIDGGALPIINHWLSQVTVGSRNGGEKFDGLIGQLSVWAFAFDEAHALNPPGDLGSFKLPNGQTVGDKLIGSLFFVPGNLFAPCFRFHFTTAEITGAWISTILQPAQVNPILQKRSDTLDHCVYEVPLYVAVCEQNGSFFLVADDGSSTQLQFAPIIFGRPVSFDAAATGRTPAARWEYVRSHSVREDQSFQIDRSFFQITPPESPLVDDINTARFAAADVFARQNSLKENPPNSQSSLQSLFTKLPSCFDCGLAGWNITKMDPQNYFIKSGQPVLSFSVDSNDFTPLPGDTHQLPFGWLRAPVPVTSGGYQSSFIETGEDLVNSTTTKHAVNVNVVIGNFNRNSQHQETQKSMYDNQTMQSVHWQIATLQDLVVDKPNLLLDVQTDAAGTEHGFKHDLRLIQSGGMKAQDFFDKYGTHYAQSIRYGAKSMLVTTYRATSVAQVLEQGDNLSWGIGFDAKGSLGVNGGPLNVSIQADTGFGYTDDKGESSSKTMHQAMQDDFGEFRCVGTSGSGCKDGALDLSNNVPVMLDLRPITDLVGPPFFNDSDICLRVRPLLMQELDAYIKGAGDIEVGLNTPPVDYYMMSGTAILSDVQNQGPVVSTSAAGRAPAISLKVYTLGRKAGQSALPPEVVGNPAPLAFVPNQGHVLLGQGGSPARLPTALNVAHPAPFGPFVIAVPPGSDDIWVAIKASANPDPDHWNDVAQVPSEHSVGTTSFLNGSLKASQLLLLQFDGVSPAVPLVYFLDLNLTKLNMKDIFLNGLPTPQ